MACIALCRHLSNCTNSRRQSQYLLWVLNLSSPPGKSPKYPASLDQLIPSPSRGKLFAQGISPIWLIHFTWPGPRRRGAGPSELEMATRHKVCWTLTGVAQEESDLYWMKGELDWENLTEDYPTSEDEKVIEPPTKRQKEPVLFSQQSHRDRKNP